MPRHVASPNNLHTPASICEIEQVRERSTPLRCASDELSLVGTSFSGLVCIGYLTFDICDLSVDRSSRETRATLILVIKGEAGRIKTALSVPPRRAIPTIGRFVA